MSEYDLMPDSPIRRSNIGNLVGNNLQDSGAFAHSELPRIRPEAEIAADFKQRGADIMKQFCLLMDEASKAGFRIQFQGIVFNPATMRNEVVDLHLVKRY